MSQDYFCSQCGNKLEPYMQFCPKCGTVISGSAAEEQMIQDQQEAYMQYHESRMNLIMFLLAIYSIPVLLMGIIILIDAEMAANTIWASDEFQNWIINHPDIDVNVADIKDCFTALGTMCTLSGVAGVISLICILARKYWIVATVACFISTLLCIWSVFGFIIGFFVSMMILSGKDYFYKDYAVKLGE